MATECYSPFALVQSLYRSAAIIWMANYTVLIIHWMVFFVYIECIFLRLCIQINTPDFCTLPPICNSERNLFVKARIKDQKDAESFLGHQLHRIEINIWFLFIRESNVLPFWRFFFLENQNSSCSTSYRINFRKIVTLFRILNCSGVLLHFWQD